MAIDTGTPPAPPGSAAPPHLAFDSPPKRGEILKRRVSHLRHETAVPVPCLRSDDRHLRTPPDAPPSRSKIATARGSVIAAKVESMYST